MLIHCPECGHQVSDKAPICPSCGVEIAGHITYCRNCGTYYLTIDRECPHCKQTNKQTIAICEENSLDSPSEGNSIIIGEPISEGDTQQIQKSHLKPKSRNSHSALLVSFTIASLICATLLYFYKDAIDKREADDYNIALNSRDTLLLQSYIDTYHNTNHAHVETIRKQLESIKQRQSKQQEATRVIETIDHADTQLSESQSQKIDESTADLSLEESQKAFNALRHFFVAINTNNREALSEAITPILDNLNEKKAATKADVIQFLINQYQADVKNLNWHLDTAPHIQKKEDAIGKVSYHIMVPAKRVIEREEATSVLNYIVTATVNKEGKVTSIDMKRE